MGRHDFFTAALFEDGENMFLAENSVLKKHKINALKNWDIPFVLTDGDVLNECPEAEMQDREKDSNYGDNDDGNEVVSVFPIEDETQYTSEQILKLPEVLENNILYQAYRDIISRLDVFFPICRAGKQSKARPLPSLLRIY
ncbi:hypothetical protein K7I13_14260 [Brucepastera parasyntrophica]|uniref:hypothetical protein n=1 Tax=Brucepastera parasyntrophica TaxID=2880008 RepID=UPI00210EC60B|nr:hypothetical protein [Brucepastera parasyntrophica]ULQ59605.1 hypothetical protein K7I13_14260 [Brucepastera parasyntrophica]